MAVKQFGEGWQVDFYAYGRRIRKVFPIKRDATAYEGKMKAAIRENRFFVAKQEAFQVFKELSSWYLSLEDVKRKKSFERDERTIKKRLDPHFGNMPIKKAKIENFTFHDFRHTAINNWRKAGHDYFKIMAASGHRTISVFKRYSMVDEGELKTLVNPESTVKKWSNSPNNPTEDHSLREANLLK